MPAIAVLRLTGPATVQIPVDAPHAALTARMDTEHHARVKPYSIGPPLRDGDGLAIRLGLLDDRLRDRLTASFRRDPAVRLGQHRYAATSLETARQETWRELAGRPPAGSWEVTFVTPTTFRRHSRSSPWPAPESVARSLLERWRALDPASAPRLSDLRIPTVWVSDIDGRSHVLQGPDALISGFVGTIRYAVEPGSPDAAAFASLMSFAGYSGIGSFTAIGLGQVLTSAGAGPADG